MKKVLVLNGVNLNMLGVREPELYGDENFAALKKYIKRSAKELGIKAALRQSNHEGKIVEYIQKARGKYDGLIVNAGAYSHTSIAILDALKAAGVPAVEVHLTDITKREAFRQSSFVALYAQKQIVGKGFEGYKEALEYFAKQQ